MPTDKERREVARRLRQAWANVPDANPIRHHMRVLCAIYEAVGFSDVESDAIDLFDRLADLIEPQTSEQTNHDEYSPSASPIDRGALLELADEMEDDASFLDKHPYSFTSPSDFRDYAERIREACGEGER